MTSISATTNRHELLSPKMGGDSECELPEDTDKGEYRERPKGEIQIALELCLVEQKEKIVAGLVFLLILVGVMLAAVGMVTAAWDVWMERPPLQRSLPGTSTNYLAGNGRDC